jgi:hypothetical protein
MLEVIEVAEDRFQVVDARGRFVTGKNSRAEAESFVEGYAEGRHDGATMAAHSTDGLAARIGGKS